MDKRKASIAVLIVAIAYFFIIPELWPEPRVEIIVPNEVLSGQDAEVEILVTAWHPNFELSSVDAMLTVNPANNRGTGVYPVSLHRAPKQNRWSFIETNRITWPRQRMFQFAIPVTQLIEDGIVTENVLEGRVMAELDYVRARRYERLPGEGYGSYSVRATKRFEIELN